jgi:hypothetical protein
MYFDIDFFSSSLDINNLILAISYRLCYHLFSNFSSQVSYPANTNILYVDLQAVEEVGSRKNASCLPGMVLNLKKAVSYVDHLGFECRYFQLPTFLYGH